LTLTVGGDVATFGEFVAAANNDCTLFDTGVISVSIHGLQTGDDRPFTLCLPRPDLIGDAPVALVENRNPPLADDRVQVVDTRATMSDGCLVARDRDGSITGTATFEGYCADDPAGYALSLSGEVTLVRTCGDSVDTVVGTLGGRVAVAIESLSAR